MQSNFNRNFHHTDTYMTTFAKQDDYQVKDKTLKKAIRQNNVDIIAPKERQGFTQSAMLFNQEKQLHGIIIDMRKKYDAAKIQTNQTEKNIDRLQAERIKLEERRVKIQTQIQEARQKYSFMQQRQKTVEDMLEFSDYTQAVRLNMKQTLKHDILTTKKQCFDLNIKLIRTKTVLKQLLQRNTNKKHYKSKCKLVLNSLQQTVQYREVQRQHHLNEVEEMLRKKMDNYDMKTDRQHFLQDSLYKALTDRLPEQKFFVKKFKCEMFFREMLRSKMRRILQQYHEVESSFETIKKTTRIKTTNQFINQYLHKQQKYGELLESIEKAQSKIQEEKQMRAELQNQHQKLEYQMYELEKQMWNQHPHVETQPLMKKLNKYSEQEVNIQKLGISMRKWAVSTIIRFQNLSQVKEQPSNFQDYSKELEGVSLKKMIIKNLKNIMEVLEQSTKKQKQEKQKTPVPDKQDKKSEMTTERTQKIGKRQMTSESVLSKDISRRNFRVKTVATTHEQALEQKDHEYDEGTQYDFLRHNRKIVKKNNKVIQRARTRTKIY